MKEIFVTEQEKEEQRKIALSLRKVLNGRKACVITFGCQQNEADSEKIRGILEECGCETVENSDDASLIIINTCAIREHAEIRALSEAGQFKGRKEREKSLLIGLCGCMAQQEGRRNQIKNSYPYVDFVFGTDMIYRIPEIIKKAIDCKKTEKKRVSSISDLPHADFGNIAEGLPVKRESNYKAWVPAMNGCNNFCTYCVVPYVRGRERSRNYEDVVAEVTDLVNRGYKDITLLGQNVNSYSGGCDFAHLLDKCCNIGSSEYRVRFMTSHPKDASSELIKVIAENERAAKHFHLPVQSGSTKILTAMNRRYTREQYIEKALEIKETIKDVALTTDIICGFPGETDEDFEQTVSLVEKVKFDMIFTFIYSKRPNTPAERMENQIPREISSKRFSRLSDTENDIAQDINNGFIGKTIRVLSDGINKNSVPCGRSTGNKIVTFDKSVKEGTFCDVLIDSAGNYSLSGKLK